MKPVLPDVFRAYDIRGIVGKDFDGAWVERLGRALGAYFLERGFAQAVVGRDCRESSPEYETRLIAGLTATGVDVITVGMVPTPVLYHAVTRLNRCAGCIVTASHNPPEYNGFKVWCGATTIHTNEVRAIHDLMARGDFPTGAGFASFHDISPSYLDELVNNLIIPLDNVKVVVDGGNGTGGELCAELLRRAGADVVPLYCEPDGRFPNHHPDPVVEKNMADLKSAVVETGADFGVGLDGDADRLGVFDETGAMVFGDRILAIFARDLLIEHPGATVISEVKSSHLLYKDIADRGGDPIMWKAGHSMIKARLQETGALLAGELSGHYFFADRYYGFDDALYAALRLAEIVAKAKHAGGPPLSGFLDDWPDTANTPELRIPCPEDRLGEIVEHARRHFAGLYEINDVDGVRITFPDGWGLIRASNTQPVLSLRFEAETPERLAEIRALVEEPLSRWITEK
ncbi:phosphomannomutase [Oceanidesulfovibrio indonesiensis]|uniref:Phosphomannomutase n=1 Tax=Oceanidesulfovibrio indonesiensis TaxID=54767 RepID=A0A7M3MIS7_9BACT|nr:phosphomannomutase/phosphoglucomutase [Oceanidesulfovibrio indonesiensis]TVM19713.1 phosphomannomutase [Oceanidesulfovibrio indonesiensis]